jgi:hypothetical protein
MSEYYLHTPHEHYAGTPHTNTTQTPHKHHTNTMHKHTTHKHHSLISFHLSLTHYTLANLFLNRLGEQEGRKKGDPSPIPQNPSQTVQVPFSPLLIPPPLSLIYIFNRRRRKAQNKAGSKTHPKYPPLTHTGISPSPPSSILQYTNHC